MNINILYLYHELLNLYGDSGNVKAIEYALKEQNIDVKIDKLSIEDDIDFSDYDLIYIGSGTEKNQLIALEHLLKYKEEIAKYINNNKFILATGNGFEFFGKRIGDNKALEILDFEADYLEKRKVGDYIKETEYGKIVAFENSGSKITNNTTPLFDEDTGVLYKNLYGTYLIGPILIRNPKFNKYFIEKLIKSKDESFEIKDIDLNLDEKAYDSYLETYYSK